MKTLGDALRNISLLNPAEMARLEACDLAENKALTPLARRLLRGQTSETDMAVLRAKFAACYPYVRPRLSLKSPVDCGDK